MRRIYLLLALVVPTVLLSTHFMAGQAGTGGTTFSGQATGVQATVYPAAPVVLSDTGPLPSSGGAQEASLVSANVPGLVSAEALHATTIGQGDRSRSEASLASLSVTVAGNTISADFLMARATAICTQGGAQVTGSSDIAGLMINGQAITVTEAPNQTIGLPAGGQVILNEQASSPGSITVNALHVLIPGVADIVISSAHADVTCPGPANCTTGGDFITGGGWIVTPQQSRANFAVAGGVKNGTFWGHLTYIDHGTGLQVKGTGVTAYMVTGTNSRHLEGTADINGQPGTYKVDTADNGEPGTGVDNFTLSLSNGYTDGVPPGPLLSGGNIQLHQPCH